MGPLSVAWDAKPSPDTLMTRADGVSVDARLLLITADGTSATFAAIRRRSPTWGLRTTC